MANSKISALKPTLLTASGVVWALTTSPSRIRNTLTV